MKCYLPKTLLKLHINRIINARQVLMKLANTIIINQTISCCAKNIKKLLRYKILYVLRFMVFCCKSLVFHLPYLLYQQ